MVKMMGWGEVENVVRIEGSGVYRNSPSTI